MDRTGVFGTFSPGSIPGRPTIIINDVQGRTLIVEIYGGTGCPFCTRAVNMCEANDLEYRYSDIRNDQSARAKLDARMTEPYRTIPQIFVDDEYIPGGFEGLANLIQKSA